MAEYGAMLLLNNGNPFVTPESTPLCLFGRYNFTQNDIINNRSRVNLGGDYTAIAFCKANKNGVVVTAIRIGNEIVIGGGSALTDSQGFTITAYIFAIFPQTLPRYGMAIWDSSGRLVLTNESKVLSDLITVGTPGTQGGVYIDQTLSGSYAVSPAVLGARVGQGAVTAGTACYYNGSTTRIFATAMQYNPNLPGIINNGNAIIAIKTDIYDQ